MKEKFYLGISLGFNSSACIVSNKKGLVRAISQERLNGQKNTKELPFDAICKCIFISNIEKVEQIAISHYEQITDDYFKKYENPRFAPKGSWQQQILEVVKNHAFCEVVNDEIVRVDHHTSHAFSTLGFYGIPKSDYYMITSDGFGDGYSGKIHFTDLTNGGVTLKNSIALVYQFVTGALGFKMHQHEGKITGLAAFGKPIHVEKFEMLYDLVETGNGLDFKENEYDLTDEEKKQVSESTIIDFDKFLKLKKAVFGLVQSLTDAGAKREDIAASVQEFSEKYTVKWIKNSCLVKHLPCYLAGGLFANVKINQRIKDLGIFSEVNVCPAMGDEGTCVGAAIAISNWDGVIKKNPQDCGTNADDTESILKHVTQYLDEHDLNDKYQIMIDTETSIYEIAKRLADNKIVCLMRNKMEFGPRALCHRSILYNADSRETNDWLNKKLSRTEFMPFAPVCTKEVADDLFVNLDCGRNSAKFMTMTFDCTEEFAEGYKAACHIDNTARPQIIHFEDDPYMHQVLRVYQDLTGKKAMINTSFNLHNWPIIENDIVALESWIKSDTDCLVIGNVFIEKK